jgi:cleavage and polyadenylation specificity factor subunit 1
MKSLTLLGKDYEPMEVYAIGLMMEGRSLSLVATDSSRNVQLFRYMPNRPDSYLGQRLIPRADFHVGSLVSKLVTLSIMQPVVQPPPQSRRWGAQRGGPPGPNPNSKQAHQGVLTASLGGTLDGGYFLITPVPEQVYWRLLALHTQMTYNLAHYAGLNPRAFRAFKTPSAARMDNNKNVVDNNLLRQFPYLPLTQQWNLARSIGTTPGQIIDNLQALDRSTRLS